MVRAFQKRRQAGLGGRTGKALADLEKDLAKIRDEGLSLSRGDYAPGIGTVAVAIRTADGSQPSVRCRWTS